MYLKENIMLDKYNFRESEKKWQEFWQEKGIYHFDKNSQKPIFSIDTPPPTVSGKIHIGHIFSYSQAEFVARYKRMRGYNVFYPFGFDDNGLPTERLVEKELNIRAHEISREEFRDKCMAVAEKYEKEFKNLFIRAGNSADWNYSYSTVSPRVQRLSQLSFIDLYKKGKAYYGEKPAIWCPECQVSIAQAELESKDIASTFNHIKFYYADNKNEYLEIATTRPEMLSACVCVFVNPDDKRYKDKIGKKVIVPLYNFEVEILTDEKASIDKGTGAVMCCTFGDETDLEWQQKHNLPIKEAITDGGRMTALAGKYEGLKIKKAREEIIKDLKENNLLIKQEDIIHAVSTHERCGTPMEIKIKKQWFISLVDDKDEFLKRGREINWAPNFMHSRYSNWVDNVNRDWCISRQRYFGVPIPVWYCAHCGKIVVADEKDLPVNPLVSKPSKPCECGHSDFIPESDVFDTWQTSSISPQINTLWNEDDEFYKKLMPMSLRPNAHDIIRTWDFYTIAKSHYHSNILPWKDVMISGFVMADKNEKISKSKSNSKMSPEALLEEKSADVTRYWAGTGSLGRDIIFSEEEFKNGAKLVNKIWNASKFVLSFLRDYTPKETKLLPMDEWIIAKFNQMQKYFIEYFEKYEIGLAMSELERFFWNFCDNYIEIAKNRLYKPEVYGEQAKASAQLASFEVLKEMLKLFAIYLPHITEEIYKDYFETFEGKISIHNTEIKQIDLQTSSNIIENGDLVCEIVSAIRRYKSENNVSLKEQIENLTLTGYPEFIKSVEYDIKAVGNVKNFEYKNGEKNIEIKMNLEK